MVVVNGRTKNDITACLHFAIKVSVGVDGDGDPAVILGQVVRLKPVLVWKGGPKGKFYRETLVLNRKMKGIVQTVTIKAKTNEACMLFIVRETLVGAIPFAPGEKRVHIVDGAPSHMHASVARAFRLSTVGTPLFISPPNSTPYSQACDKQYFNGIFGSEMEESYAEWAEACVMGRGKRGPVPAPSREEVATWVLHAFNSISDDAIRKACSRAYFPNGLKLSELEDEEYFRSQGKRPFDPPSESDSGSETPTVVAHQIAVLLMTQTMILTMVVTLFGQGQAVVFGVSATASMTSCTLLGI